MVTCAMRSCPIASTSRTARKIPSASSATTGGATHLLGDGGADAAVPAGPAGDRDRRRRNRNPRLGRHVRQRHSLGFWFSQNGGPSGSQPCLSREPSSYSRL